MHIVLATIGTLGDATPLVALGAGLARRGHRVTLATHDDYEALVTRAGLGFRPIGGSFKRLVESDLGRDWLESADSLLRYTMTTRRVLVPLSPRWLDDAARAVEGADAVLAHPAVFGAFAAAERAGIPRLAVTTMPFLPSAETDPVFFPNVPAWGWLRKGLGQLSARGIGALFLPSVNQHRRTLGLPPFETPNMAEARVNRGLPWINLYSPTLVPRPSDWPAAAHVTGFCFLDDPTPLSAELEAFLARGAPPLFLGFGSMTGRDPEALARLTIDAIRRSGQRAVVSLGWGGLGRELAGDDLFVASFVPFQRLLPRVSAVVCHGGAGTVAAALRAGRPTQVVAFFGDQQFWGKRVAALGAGPRPLLRRELSVARLSDGIVETVTNPSYVAGAARAAAGIGAEDGVATAVARIEEHLAAVRPTAAGAARSAPA